MKALDLEVPVSPGKANQIKTAGFQAVGIYARSDRSPKWSVEDLHGEGLKLFTAYELGHPDKIEYYSASQGVADAKHFVAWASLVGKPVGSVVFTAVDGDFTEPQIRGPILEYQKAFREIARGKGYAVGVYGSGLACKTLINLGYAHYGWLSGSTGWAGYGDFAPHAAILQGALDQTYLGMSVDFDVVNDSMVCW